jgi:hypothetical protein
VRFLVSINPGNLLTRFDRYFLGIKSKVFDFNPILLGGVLSAPFISPARAKSEKLRRLMAHKSGRHRSMESHVPFNFLEHLVNMAVQNRH